ncbi:tetratricopeptide repeat protein [Paracoccus aminophilus]|uniref:Cell division coordinator CpoB n=1 Tax=Paracoccus aminophilus JCM 7686 TaxID=1367847 RepID=S5YQR8_PARAH|nr:tetratricopeptide repeat protein [Paracoccus aminophilus]AGT07586.1 tol-pal system protein YbgF [Paracoccus aminophilus JCM 7686]
MRRLLLAAGLALVAFGAQAQDKQTLADIRSELGQLSSDLQSLRAELAASGQAGYAAAGGESAIDRMNAMEAELQQLTGQTEQLQNRIDRVVKDGTTRIGDIEFRLCEMEDGCDLGTLTTPQLGQQHGSANLPPSSQTGMLNGGATRPSKPSASAATTAEKADFDRARGVLGQGDFRRAADLFAAVAETHAGGPLTAEALFLRGAALDSAGDLHGAGVAWLDSFAADPMSPQAPDALLGLSRAEAGTGDARNGCPFLQEILVRFPDVPQAEEAEKRITALGCDAMDTEVIEDADPAANLPSLDDPEAAADFGLTQDMPDLPLTDAPQTDAPQPDLPAGSAARP